MTIEQPIISIIVPCYNGEQFLHETLGCLQQQTISQWECIVVNDGSTDRSADIVREYRQKDNRYKLIDKQNEGPSVARNIGIKASRGRYILPLDSDDLIHSAYAETAVVYLESHPKTKLVYCEAEYFGKRTGRWQLPDYNHDLLLWSNPVFCSAVFRRSDFDLTSGYNPKMRHGIEDWDFWLSLLGPDDEVYRIPKVMFYYRQHGLTRSDDSNANIDAALAQMMRNHLDLYTPYLGRLFRAEGQVEYLQGEIQKLLSSRKYRLGSFLLHPIATLRRAISTKINRDHW